MGGAYKRIISQTELGHFSLKKGGAYQEIILQTELGHFSLKMSDTHGNQLTDKMRTFFLLKWVLHTRVLYRQN